MRTPAGSSGGLRPLLKSLAEVSLAGSGVPRISRAFRRRDALVLAFHNVVPDGETAVGDLSLHLPQREFARQLDSLARTHEVVPLRAIFEPPATSRPRVAVTFDDAYRGAVEAGVAELSSRGLPGTIFVAPGFVGGGSFWWDELVVPGSDALPARVRRHCLDRLGGEHARIRSWAAEEGIPIRAVPRHQTVADEGELANALAHPGIVLASHSWSHPDLTALGLDELENELIRPLRWLRERFGEVLPWLSYPYGLSSRAVEAAVERAGYRGALRVDGGWLPRPGRPYRSHALPRLNVPAGISLRGFELYAAGVLPFAPRGGE